MGQPRALVIGGSVGGLFAAHLLRMSGWDALVFERTSGDLGDRGTGIGTREELFALMRRIGLSAETTRGTAVHGRIGLSPSGRPCHELRTPAVTSAWSRIWRPLRQAWPDQRYAGGKVLSRVEQDRHSVTAIFADGSHDTGDMLIAADGLHSSVRAQLLPGTRPSYAGYVAWRGVVDERCVSPALHGLLFDHMLFGFPDGEMMLSIPMPGAEDGPYAGQRRCHFVWFRPAVERDLAGLCTDSSGRCHGLSIPPPLIRPDLIATLQREAQSLLAPQLAALVSATDQIILQPIFDLAAPQMAFGRIALLGDAAFVARPHVASGVMKAGIDAETLASRVEGGSDVPTALSRYNAERQPYGAWLVARGRHIGGYFTDRGGDPHARVEALMREYGSAGVVGGEPIAARR